ncbi:MAG: redoxin family protein [Parvularculaceae bacterium]
MRAAFSPRLWLFIWLGIGAAALLYVILAASLSAGPGKKQPRRQGAEAVLHDPALQVGAMAKFIYAPEARTAPAETFLHRGETTSLLAFRGRAVLVNFWATWCAPCVKELPSLDRLEKKLGGEDFEVVAVAADPTGEEKASAFLDKLGLENLKHYADPQLKLAIAAGGSASLPLSILYDAEGREIGRYSGEADWSSPEAERLIRRAIAQK